MDADRTVALLRKMRHDFGNHLQVISGYLELNHPEKVRQYVDKLILNARTERVVFEASEGETALYLYEQMLTAYDYDIKLIYQKIDIASVEPLMRANEPLHTLIQLKEKKPAAELTVEVVIGTTLEQDIYIDYFTEDFAGEPQRLLIRK
ncbi:MAG TPA: Spo0B domain-containing protein [Syntrophomonadaceae bacterium]|jgi:hypothetical protein|nr:Spo0B domain-containing protein [Syntrophomonadaceae bacterium]HRX20655.1 Spo0B domain-containing protein [Syntrophomonadaceae bacterium]